MKIKFAALKDLQAKKPAELDTYIAEMKKTSAELMHQIHTGKEKSTHQLGLIKKSIARAYTVRTQQAKKEEK
jgi:ribosomal protein L29